MLNSRLTRSVVATSSVRSTILFVFALGFVVLGGSGCVKKTIGVPLLLTPLAEAKTAELEAQINRLASVRSIKGKVDIQFQDTSFAESGIAEKYRTADGMVILQRPNQIYLAIQTPFVGKDLAEMTSDGERFRVAVLAPFSGGEKYRSFLRGTNNAVYAMPKMDGAMATAKKNGKNLAMTEERAVSVLANLRPQHFTDALLIVPILPHAESRLVYAQSEIYQEERDTRPDKRNARVVRGYYLLDELSPGDAGTARLVRRFWFDRVGGIRLARLQTFDASGVLTTDVSFSDAKQFGEGGRVTLPARVEVTRPQEHYKLSIGYQSPEAVVLDQAYKPQTFLLENSSNLREVDLDTRRSKQEASSK
ncbi:MAG: hypothetical protein ABR577_04910 [Pyrinomonadaceae bacterium]